MRCCRGEQQVVKNDKYSHTTTWQVVPEYISKSTRNQNPYLRGHTAVGVVSITWSMRIIEFFIDNSNRRQEAEGQRQQCWNLEGGKKHFSRITFSLYLGQPTAASLLFYICAPCYCYFRFNLIFVYMMHICICMYILVIFLYRPSRHCGSKFLPHHIVQFLLACVCVCWFLLLFLLGLLYVIIIIIFFFFNFYCNMFHGIITICSLSSCFALSCTRQPHHLPHQNEISRAWKIYNETAIQCSTPVAPLNGRIGGTNLNQRRLTVGALVTFSCNEGHTLVGEPSIICTETGLWSHPPPFCK